MIIETWLDAVTGLSKSLGWTKESACFLMKVLGYSNSPQSRAMATIMAMVVMVMLASSGVTKLT